MKRSVYTRPAKPLRIAAKARSDFDKVDIPSAPEIVAVDKATECHVTPPEVAARMVRYLGPVGDYLTLEPSAGTGNLSRALLESGHSRCELVQVERHIGVASQLRRFGTVINRCFLDYSAEVRGKVEFPRVLMNPPFSHARQHIAAALDLMGPHGHVEAPTLVALVPDSFEAEGMEVLEHLPHDTFATAKVRTKIIRIRLQHPKAAFTSLDAERCQGLVLNAPEFFADKDFVAWLRSDVPKFTWHRGDAPDEYSDVVVLVDPDLGGEGSDSDMPEHIWTAIVEQCRTHLGASPGQSHYMVRITNLAND
ncbi:hypothetical protein PX554_20045 [Sphingomonas sp. H39-1-10]|uniref:hypothetical protein n=1 Tax=Sphingomonas pollutisoli TaxID=3030829 RepID=UPI0023B9EA85|nr:hypothetical protein [Sphingomonas pollutisoli]MDF0490425.1 hypothetical protein [Sphingomonas pollutisoli]